jgi:hypothetical protein
MSPEVEPGAPEFNHSTALEKSPFVTRFAGPAAYAAGLWIIMTKTEQRVTVWSRDRKLLATNLDMGRWFCYQ